MCERYPTLSDPTAVEERLKAYVMDLRIGITRTQRVGIKSIGATEFEKEELQVVGVFLRVINEGGISEILLALKSKDHALSNTAKIRNGLLKGLIAIIPNA